MAAPRKASRVQLEAELRACASDIQWRIWHGAVSRINQRTHQREVVEVYKFYSRAGLAAYRYGLDAALSLARKQCRQAFEARNQKALYPETETRHIAA